VNLQATVIFDEAQLPKLVHEETHPGPRGPDHFGQGFLTDSRNDELLLPVFAEAGQQQQSPSQPFLTGIEKLIDQVLLDPHIPGQQVIATIPMKASRRSDGGWVSRTNGPDPSTVPPVGWRHVEPCREGSSNASSGAGQSCSGTAILRERGFVRQ
jgi:hypothetical protein